MRLWKLTRLVLNYQIIFHCSSSWRCRRRTPAWGPTASFRDGSVEVTDNVSISKSGTLIHWKNNNNKKSTTQKAKTNSSVTSVTLSSRRNLVKTATKARPLTHTSSSSSESFGSLQILHRYSSYNYLLSYLTWNGWWTQLRLCKKLLSTSVNILFFSFVFPPPSFDLIDWLIDYIIRRPSDSLIRRESAYFPARTWKRNNHL